MLKNLNIKMRMGLGFGLVIMMTLIITMVATLQLGSINKAMDKIVNDRWPKTVWMNEIADKVNLTARAMRNAILFIDEKEVKQKELGRIEEADKVIDEKIEMLNKTVQSDKEKELLKAITDSQAAYLKARRSILEAIKEGKKNEAAKMLITKLRPIQNEGFFRSLKNMTVYQGSLIVEDRERELESISMKLFLGLSEVFEALKRIFSGDPTARLAETSEVELTARLKQRTNLTPDNIGEIVNQSHEFAIDMAEHFDIPYRVSKGDLDAGVSESSYLKVLR